MPQGSKTTVRGRVIQAGTPKSRAAHKLWREQVTWAATSVMLSRSAPPLDVAAWMVVEFRFAPPQRPKRGLWWKATRPDLDKLVRAVGDSLTDAGVVTEDSRFVLICAVKRYAGVPGATVKVGAMDDGRVAGVLAAAGWGNPSHDGPTMAA